MHRRILWLQDLLYAQNTYITDINLQILLGPKKIDNHKSVKMKYFRSIEDLLNVLHLLKAYKKSSIHPWK